MNIFCSKESKVCISSSDAKYAYLCDFVYFKSLHDSNGRSLFIHVPPLNEPFTAQELAEIINMILHKIVDQILVNV